MPDLIGPVRFRDCACPNTPHPDGDVAYLRPYLDYAGGAEALAAIQKSNADPILMPQLLGPVFIRRGVADWNLLDEDGDPVPVTDEALDALRWEDAYDLADKADDIYGGQVLAPLVKRLPKPSPTGRTGRSTRAGSSRKTPPPSEPSSSES
jgi:hypothetical protein